MSKARTPKGCTPANNYADCPFKRLGYLDACHLPGGCLNRSKP